MADNITIKDAFDANVVIATEDVGGVHRQRTRLMGTVEADLAAIKTAVELIDNAIAGTEMQIDIAAGNKIQISDGTSDATVRNLAANDALNVAIVDGAGNHVTTFGGTGGTSSTDDADFTAATTPGTPAMGVYEPSPTAVTAGDMGIVGITQSREMKISVEASSLDVAHDNPDSGNPVKVGARAVNALPTAVTSADRANAIADLFGRVLTSHIDPAMQVWKQADYTTQQTGAVIWDPAVGKKIAITSIVVGSRGTTAGRLILWFGANADTTYNAGTDQLVLAASYAPSSTSKPGTVLTPAVPIFSNTADFELHATTDAAMSVDITVYGYEF